MESIKTLVLVLTPMFVGFAIRLPKPYLKMLDLLLVWLVYAILLLIGIGLAQVGGLWSLLNDIALRVALLFTLLMRAGGAWHASRGHDGRYQTGGSGGVGRGHRQAIAACAAAA